MKRLTISLAILCVAAPAAARAQAVPAATTGPHLPLPSGKFNYSVRYSQMAAFEGAQGTQGDWQASTLSGDVNYMNGSHRRPFALNYGGVYSWTISGPAYQPGLSQHLVVSQGIGGHRWNASVSDDVSYSPQGSGFGFTGIPGTGEPIAGSGAPPPVASETILAVNTHTLNNNVTGNYTTRLNASAALNLGGGYMLLRFPDGIGFDTNSENATGGISWRLDARNSLTTNYTFSHFSYPGSGISIGTQSGLFGIARSWTRTLNTSVAAGPQWTTSSLPALIPPSLGVTANANVSYQFGRSSAGLAYSRGVGTGAGFMTGSEVDTASANYSHPFGRTVNLGLTASYNRSAQLAKTGTVSSKTASAQASRRLGRYLTLFANYSAETQSSSATLPGNALNQLIQLVSFGFGYTPREISLRAGR